MRKRSKEIIQVMYALEIPEEVWEKREPEIQETVRNCFKVVGETREILIRIIRECGHNPKTFPPQRVPPYTEN